jgi:hypothetical protein
MDGMRGGTNERLGARHGAAGLVAPADRGHRVVVRVVLVVIVVLHGCSRGRWVGKEGDGCREARDGWPGRRPFSARPPLCLAALGGPQSGDVRRLTPRRDRPLTSERAQNTGPPASRPPLLLASANQDNSCRRRRRRVIVSGCPARK